MRSNLRAIAQTIASGVDPKSALFEASVNAEKITVAHNLVLVATFVESEKTAGGIIKPQRSLDEGRYQGKCGLVLACGPTAFVEQPPHATFGGFSVKRGDWVMFRFSDGTEMFLSDGKGGGTSIRLLEDIHVKLRVDDPRMIY